jgi:hypothetical protein
MKVFLTILGLLPFLIFAKQIEVDTFLVAEEARIGAILKSLRATRDEAEKESINIDLESELEDLLSYPGVMTYPFSSWETMSTIVSPDGAFRIFNWNIEDKDLKHSHFCFVVRPKGSRDNQVYKFKEDRITLSPKPDMMLTPDRWYGALYYKIVPVQKGNKTYYTILGYSGKDRSTNMKLLDVFYFKGKTLRMGHPMFQESKGSKRLLRRVFFEYSEKAVVSMNMNEKLGGIVFDHLVPEQKNLEGMYSFYIPDMTYDAYKEVNGSWMYIEDVIAYNETNRKYRTWHPSDGGDSSEYDLSQNFWIDPVDASSPVNSGTDATAPIEDVRESGKKNARKNKKNEKGFKKAKRFKLFNRKKKNKSAITLD